MVVVTEPLPATLEPVVLPGFDSATVYCSGPSTRPSLIAPRLMTRLHRAAGAGVGQRAGAGIEAQIGAAGDRRGHRRREVRMVSAGGADIGERQMDGRRLARLQRAGQVHRVARRAALGDAGVAADRPGRRVGVVDGGGHRAAAAHTLAPVVLPGLDRQTVYCSGPSTRPSSIAARLMTRLASGCRCRCRSACRCRHRSSDRCGRRSPPSPPPRSPHSQRWWCCYR